MKPQHTPYHQQLSPSQTQADTPKPLETETLQAAIATIPKRLINVFAHVGIRLEVDADIGGNGILITIQMPQLQPTLRVHHIHRAAVGAIYEVLLPLGMTNLDYSIVIVPRC